MIGVLTYFLGFQIEQSERGISINKERYVKDLLKKYDKIGSSVNTPIVPPNILRPDLNGKAVMSLNIEEKHLKCLPVARRQTLCAGVVKSSNL
ncbi:hypothetical protein Tco_0309135 [Tanacetum coccineum]